LTIRGQTIRLTLLHLELPSGLVYQVERLTLPPALRPRPGSRDLEESLKDLLLKEFRGTLARESEARLGNLSGKEYLIETGQGLARARVFVGTGGRVVILHAEGTREQVQDRGTQVFLDSCRLGAPPAAPPAGRPAEPPDQRGHTKIQGGGGDPEFTDRAPEGGLLVGFEIGLGKFVNNDVVHAGRPVYRVGDKESLGKQYGTDTSRVVRVVAKPGYAVGAITAKAGLTVDGMSVTFMKVTSTGRLDPQDSYESDWIGGMGGGGPERLGGDGSPVIGIIGKANVKDMTGLGLLMKPPAEVKSKIQGGGFDPEFADRAPEGGLLVGFEIGLGKFFDNDVVRAGRPVYRVGDKESLGKQYGTDTSRVVRVVAKPGYAVGAIMAKAGLTVDGMSVTFMKVIAGGRLDPQDSYESDWIGGMGGGGPERLGGDGSPVIGIIGRANAKDMTGLGLLLKPSPTSP
jgi:hypothetical protein